MSSSSDLIHFLADSASDLLRVAEHSRSARAEGRLEEAAELLALAACLLRRPSASVVRLTLDDQAREAA